MAMHSSPALDLTFRALGDATRRSMLEELSRGHARSAGELGELFDSAQPTISKHLKVLERAGLIERTIEGRVHRFSLRPKSLHQAGKWITTHEAFWMGAVDQLERMLGREDER